MGAISDLIHRMNCQDVALVAHTENGGATPKPAPTLGFRAGMKKARAMSGLWKVVAEGLSNCFRKPIF